MARVMPLLCTITLIGVMASGCVSRQLHITSEPEGAEVLINDTHSGTTPMTHRFVHYQTFRIHLQKEGYKPLIVEERISPPPYEQPGVDFISEALIPAHIEDRRELHYTLEEVGEVDPAEEVIRRAAERRNRLAEAVEARKAAAKEAKHITLPLPVKERVKKAEANDAAVAEEPTEDAPAEDASGPVPATDGSGTEGDAAR